MARVLLLCGSLSLQILQCLSQDYPSQPQEKDPSVGEYFLEAVDWMNRTRWRYFLPENTDIDRDGHLSDLEVRHKFNTYMGEVFKLIDHDKDNSIDEEELRSLKLDIAHLTKVVDIALENFPLKPFFLVADGNGDGVYDENDFYIPEDISRHASITRTPTNVSIGDDFQVLHHRYGWRDSCHGYGYGGYCGYTYNVTTIGQHEGTVICKSLGFEGLERVREAHKMEIPHLPEFPVAYSCDGTEKRLEDCEEVPVLRWDAGMGVVCRGKNIRESLHLVGGKDSSAGDIYVGEYGMTCVNWRDSRSTFEVICRELGYSGVLRMTRGSAFTGKGVDNVMETIFNCKGNEEKLEDCLESREHCSGWGNRKAYGVACATEGQTGLNQGLSKLLRWESNQRIWEEGGRFLFIADANDDGKLTLEELATKGKELMIKILDFLDVNQDGKISLEDIDLHLTLRPIQNLVTELFDDVTKGQGELDLYNIEIAGQDMSKFFGSGLKGLDNNRDEKLNADDMVSNYGEVAEVTFLIPMVSEKLDKNQDGMIQREELRQFIDDMFKQLDMDKNGALTLEDVYSILRHNGLNCLQVRALRSYIKVFLKEVDTMTRNFFGYIFHQFDIDGNGQISLTELEQMHVPCDTSKRYGYRGPDYDSDPNARKTCSGMFETYFGRKIDNLIHTFPDSIFSERHQRGRNGHGRGGRDEPQRETLVDKLTDHACEMLT